MKYLAIVCLLLFGAIIEVAAQKKYIQLESERGITMHKLGYSEADPGKEYILIKINVENHGYVNSS
jgi:hypothetical protein